VEKLYNHYLLNVNTVEPIFVSLIGCPNFTTALVCLQNGTHAAIKQIQKLALPEFLAQGLKLY
jgi:hypothetical protein